jgi:hypothetical protein
VFISTACDGPEGQDYWSTDVYRGIVPQERIVCIDSFADEKGNPVPASHYGMGDGPAELQVMVTFEEHEGKQRSPCGMSASPPAR